MLQLFYVCLFAAALGYIGFVHLAPGSTKLASAVAKEIQKVKKGSSGCEDDDDGRDEDPPSKKSYPRHVQGSLYLRIGAVGQ